MRHKLKLTSIFFSLIFFACGDSDMTTFNDFNIFPISDSNLIITENKNPESCKKRLDQLFMNCYQEDDKVYFVSCSGRNLMLPHRYTINELPEIELKIGDT
ncbi:MAG: hypothetical protein AB8F94_27370, partial [Saprospiraceae bacterium]